MAEMTPAEVTTILRQLHDWLRGGTQWAPTMGAESVKTAIEMIERLEAAEKSDAESIAMYRKARDERDALRAAVRHEADCVEACKSEIEALRAKIARMEQQEPVFWWRPCSDGAYEGPLHNNSIERVRKQSGAWSPLYALPGAKGED